MSVRGEFRRLLKDLLVELRSTGLTRDVERELEPLLERALEDLSGAAEAALALLPRVEPRAGSDSEQRRRFEDAFDRLDAVCRVILGRRSD